MATATRPTPPATIERWEPFRELLEGVMVAAGAPEQLWTPRVDIEETEDTWIVEAELPGVKRQDVDIEVRDGEVVISGEIKERERVGILRRRTRRMGKFEYRVSVPSDVDGEKIEANLEEGILTVRIPKPERVQPRKVEVKSAE